MTWWTNLSTEKKASVLAGGIVVAILASVIVTDRLEENRGPGELDAQIACEDFVKDRLKSPASAKFSNYSHAAGESGWTITGDVDADNSFGASLRSRFTCVVELADGRWRLRSLSGLT